MKVNYFDKIKYLYPNISGVVYWQTQYDGTPWNDLYDGIVWDNKDIDKPDKQTLDALDDVIVSNELANRVEVIRKQKRDKDAKSNLSIIAHYNEAHSKNLTLELSQYLDSLEELAKEL